MPVFKVFYQENSKEIPVRENTQVLFVEADGVPAVRKYLDDRNYNIERCLFRIWKTSGRF